MRRSRLHRRLLLYPYHKVLCSIAVLYYRTPFLRYVLTTRYISYYEYLTLAFGLETKWSCSMAGPTVGLVKYCYLRTPLKGHVLGWAGSVRSTSVHCIRYSVHKGFNCWTIFGFIQGLAWPFSAVSACFMSRAYLTPTLL